MKNLTNDTRPSIYIDANVILEVVFERKNQYVARKLLVDNFGDISISALTAHIVTYFSKKILCLKDIEVVLSDFEILGLDSDSFDWAFKNTQNTDIEDALQMSVAIKNNQSIFYTFDKTLHRTYKNSSLISVRLLG